MTFRSHLLPDPARGQVPNELVFSLLLLRSSQGVGHSHDPRSLPTCGVERIYSSSFIMALKYPQLCPVITRTSLSLTQMGHLVPSTPISWKTMLGRGAAVECRSLPCMAGFMGNTKCLHPSGIPSQTGRRRGSMWDVPPGQRPRQIVVRGSHYPRT